MKSTRFTTSSRPPSPSSKRVRRPLIASSPLRRNPSGDSAWVSADTPVPYRVADMVHIIDEWLGKLDQRYPRSDLRSLKFRLETLSCDPRFRFMFGRVVVEDTCQSHFAHLPPAQAGAPVTIIQFGRPSQRGRQFARLRARAHGVRNRALERWELRNRGGVRRGPSLHSHRPVAGVRTIGQAIGRIARKVASTASRSGIVTQRPAELDATVLSQCSTMFAMCLANEHDKAIIRSAVGVSSASTIAFLFFDRRPRSHRLRRGDRDADANEVRRLSAEPPSSASADPEPQMAHLDLRKIVCRLRGEYSSDFGVTVSNGGI